MWTGLPTDLLPGPPPGQTVPESTASAAVRAHSHVDDRFITTGICVSGKASQCWTCVEEVPGCWGSQ
jgi:hypothetical protein